MILPSSGHAAWDELAAWRLSRYKPSTQQTYASYLPRWSRWCANRRIDPLAARRADVELRLRAVADSGLSRASVAAHYDAVASLYRLAYEEELVPADPCARVTRPKIQRELQRRKVLTVLEYAAFLTTARTLGTSHHAIAVLGGMMGLRATEMATLTVPSFGTVRGYATLTVLGKGDKPARVPVPIPALGAVQVAIDGRTAGPLLRTRTGAGMDRRTVYRYVAATAKAAGISRSIGPHALRRTVGTVGLNQGIPLRDVQRLLRHARPGTTLGSYDITGEALERHASHQVAGFLAGWAG
ncbi:tyrosine-type recombinase/integrase [Geodermatophilus sp. SYSU D00698]